MGRRVTRDFGGRGRKYTIKRWVLKYCVTETFNHFVAVYLSDSVE